MERLKESETTTKGGGRGMWAVTLGKGEGKKMVPSAQCFTLEGGAANVIMWQRHKSEEERQTQEAE
jgi:hypothetical protein